MLTGVMTTADRPAHERAMSRVHFAKRLRRWTLVLGMVALAWSWLWYGARWVPAGMDTVPDMPPGTFCVIAKRTGSVHVDSHVFIEIGGGDVVLSQVVGVDRAAGTVSIRHPNPESRIPDSRALGSLPLRSVQGTVLGAFKPGADDGGR